MRGIVDNLWINRQAECLVVGVWWPITRIWAVSPVSPADDNLWRFVENLLTSRGRTVDGAAERSPEAVGEGYGAF
jgi:hypothetical protein